MRAILDHIGIAVADLPAALGFYRDALGLRVEAPEDVVTQSVRAHFIPVGESALELLESTSPDSPIGRFLDKRGPGIHHITLRVDDIRATLAQLKSRGVRLIDEQPVPGADGAQVGFVHPAAAHGVLIELKQPRGARAGRGTADPEGAAEPLRIQRFTIGDIEVTSLYDGFLRLDGGSMFGVVPRALWEKKAVPDEHNRILLAMRPLLVRGVRTLLIDAGLGDKENEKFHHIYGVDRGRHLDHALAEAGVSPEDIDVVLATHLHFDHAGGFTMRDAAGRIRPRFPRARYVVRRGEWEDATHPHERNRASYRPDNFLPLADAGVLELVDADQTIMPGVKVQRTGGHTMHHQLAWIESGAARGAYVADLVPTTAHLPNAWIMGYDLYPMDTLSAKQALFRELLARETLLFFGHDPAVAAGYLTDENGARALRRSS